MQTNRLGKKMELNLAHNFTNIYFIGTVIVIETRQAHGLLGDPKIRSGSDEVGTNQDGGSSIEAFDLDNDMGK